MQVLYSRVITVMDAAAIQEKWEVAETNKMKGQIKEVHSRATSIIQYAKKQKQKELAMAKTTRRETQVTSLIGNIDASIGPTGILTERVASEVEDTAAKLTQEASLLDKEIDEVALVDQNLAERLEKLRCNATASVVKANGSIRRFRGEDDRSQTTSIAYINKKRRDDSKMSKAASDNKKEGSGYTKQQLSKLAAGEKWASKKKGRRSTAWPSSPSESSSAAEDDEESEEDTAYTKAEAKRYQREQRQYQHDGNAKNESRTTRAPCRRARAARPGTSGVWMSGLVGTSATMPATRPAWRTRTASSAARSKTWPTWT